MMYWDKELQPASFRGIRFHAEEVPGEMGRRVLVHEYPLRDEPETEDMGAAAKKYNFKAFLLGADALQQRDVFEAALNQNGVGTLIHPFYGALRVRVASARPIYSAKKRGRISYSISFVEAGKEQYPNVEIDSYQKLADAVNQTTGASETAYAEQLDPSGPGYILDSIKAQLNDVLSGLNTLNCKADALTQPVSDIAAQIDAISNELTELILQPRTMAMRISSLINAVLAISPCVERALDAYEYLGLTASQADEPPQTTASRIQQGKNREVTIHFVSTVATLEAVRFVAGKTKAKDVTNVNDSPFTSYSHAIAVRDQLINALDELALTANDTVYTAITECQAQLQRHIDGHGARLQRLQSKTLIVSHCDLVLAYQLYGDANRGADIVARNNVKHPGFIPAGVALEVLQPEVQND